VVKQFPGVLYRCSYGLAGLAVLPNHVVAADGWAPDGRVVLVMVVHGEPRVEGAGPSCLRSIGLGVGPLVEKGPVVALNFAVGPRAVGLGPGVGDVRVHQLGTEVPGDVALAVRP
jgi:hypothetical protein